MSADSKLDSWEAAVTWLRSRSDKSDLVYAAYFEDPPLAAAERFHDSGEWQATRELLGLSNGKVLDIGAGRGIASYAFARDGFTVTAIEPDPSFLVGAGAIRALAAEEELEIEVVQDQSEQLPFPDASFDIVYARAVLHHIEDLVTVCKEIARVLKPGGLFLAVREHVISQESDLPRFLEIHPLHHKYGGENAFLLEHYVRAIQDGGLTIRRVLRPLESRINLEPSTTQLVIDEVARRLEIVPGIGRLVRMAAGIGPLRQALLAVISRFDHRPGRHFSFLASRELL